MLSDKDYSELLEDLHSNQLSMRVSTLIDLRQFPCGDKRILPHLEALLDDRTVCLIGIPFEYGEIRYLAAYALQAERTRSNIEESVYLPNTFYPLNSKQMFETIEKTKITESGDGVEGMIQTLAKLLEIGGIPLINLELNPTSRLRE